MGRRIIARTVPMTMAVSMTLFVIVLGLKGIAGEFQVLTLSSIAAILVVCVFTAPLVAIVRGDIPWTNPMGICALTGMVAYGIPSIYHAIRAPGSSFRTAMESTVGTMDDERLAFVLLCIGFEFGIGLLLSTLRPEGVGGERSDLRSNGGTHGSAIAAGVLLVGAALVALVILHGSIGGYLSEFRTLRVRDSHDLGEARFSMMSRWALPGALLIWTAWEGRLGFGRRYWVTTSLLVFCSGLPFYNTGGRGEFAKWVACWLAIAYLAGRIRSLKAPLIGVLTVALGIVIITGARAGILEGPNSSWSLLGVAAAGADTSVLLKADKIAATAYSIDRVSTYLHGETYVAGLAQVAAKPAQWLAGVNLVRHSGWSMAQYHGYWLTGSPANTGYPSSMVGEDFANFGLLGTLCGGLLLGVLLRTLSAQSMRLEGVKEHRLAAEIRGNRSFRRSDSDSLWTVMHVLLVIAVLPRIMLGGWGAASMQFFYEYLPAVALCHTLSILAPRR